jgi:LemA protein
LAKKKNQKRAGGNYSGNRVKKEDTYGSTRRRTYMILSTAAIIIGLIMTGVQSLGSSRSNVELAYSDITTAIREMEDGVSSYAREAEKADNSSGESARALIAAYSALAEAGSVKERSDALNAFANALASLHEAADEAGMSVSSYKAAGEAVDRAADGLNAAVSDYNTKAEVYNKSVSGFPKRILAGIMGYTEADLFSGRN